MSIWQAMFLSWWKHLRCRTQQKRSSSIGKCENALLRTGWTLKVKREFHCFHLADNATPGKTSLIFTGSAFFFLSLFPFLSFTLLSLLFFFFFFWSCYCCYCCLQSAVMIALTRCRSKEKQSLMAFFTTRMPIVLELLGMSIDGGWLFELFSVGKKERKERKKRKKERKVNKKKVKKERKVNKKKVKKERKKGK